MSGEDMHISFETLADLADDRLDKGNEADIRAHLESCEECRATFTWIRQTIHTMQAGELEDAPVHVIARAVRAFRDVPHPEVQPEPAGALRRLVAMLQFDSGTMAPAAGLRATHAAPRQMLFSAESVDIDIRMALAGDLWEVSGQVLGECESGEVWLSGADASVETRIDEHCEFHLEPVPVGVYTMVLRFDGNEVTVPDLQIGDKRGSG